MGNFRLSDDRLHQSIKNLGGELKGIFVLQYPIYCIHANITDSTLDPLDKIDRIIVSMLLKHPNLTFFQLGALIGISKTFTEVRVKQMLSDGLLEKGEEGYSLTSTGNMIFVEDKSVRTHQRSYDFYIDGINLQPLTIEFYKFYRSKYISEDDSIEFINRFGEPTKKKLFSPDVVHTPPASDRVIEGIESIDAKDRDTYGIPTGLVHIDDWSYTRVCLPILICVSKFKDRLEKQIIDGFSSYSVTKEGEYYHHLQQNLKIFEKTLSDKIRHLEFKIMVPAGQEGSPEGRRPILTSNWGAITLKSQSENKCFSFSSEDLLSAIDNLYKVMDPKLEMITNSDTDIRVNIDKPTLLASPHRSRTLDSLLRERNNFKPRPDKNVFSLNLYYGTEDEFVKQALSFRSKIRKVVGPLTIDSIETNYPHYKDNYRELLIACGETELLEALDIERFMYKVTQ